MILILGSKLLLRQNWGQRGAIHYWTESIPFGDPMVAASARPLASASPLPSAESCPRRFPRPSEPTGSPDDSGSEEGSVLLRTARPLAPRQPRVVQIRGVVRMKQMTLLPEAKETARLA